MSLCCLYKKSNGDRYTLCTSDDNCPQITGDTLIGDWGVDDCDDCGTSDSQPNSDEIQFVQHRSSVSDFLKELEQIPAVIALLEKWGLTPFEEPGLPSK